MITPRQLRDARDVARIGLEGAWQLGPLRLQGEGVRAEMGLAPGTVPVGAGRTARFDSGCVQASLALDRPPRAYRLETNDGTAFGIVGDVALPDERRLSRGGPGAFELSARYDPLDLSEAPTGGTGTNWTVGLTWRPELNVKVLANYTSFDLRRPASAGGDTRIDLTEVRLHYDCETRLLVKPMLSLTDLARRIADGTLTGQGAIRLSQEAIEARDGALGAIVCRDPNPAIPAHGPLAGIAVGVKDIIDTADLPTRMGSPIYDGWRPRADAAIVARLKSLGAVPLAKTATTAFAGLDPAETVNPHDPGHTPGGSSSGSAAAVAAGLLPLALGTQTGGSVIRPAAFCGVCAIKPSFRLLPMVGIKTFSWALDTLGLFGAGVADIARALALIADRPEIDPGAREHGAPRIGLCLQGFAGEADADALAALTRAAQAAERAGAAIVDLTLPEPFAAAWAVHGLIQDVEARQALAWEYARHRDLLPEILAGQLDRAQALRVRDYDDARRTAHRARRQLKDVFADLDAILTVSAVGRAPATLASTGDARFNRLWTLMGVPCVTVPVPGDGLPLGVQVVARFGDDGRALAVAAMIEGALRE